MTTLLIVNSSPRSNSVSRRLTRHAADMWKAENPDGRVIERDLAANPLPFVTESWIQASYTPGAERTPEQEGVLELSNTLIQELVDADVIVLGVPMHNFSIPAALKAWIDLIVRAGKTFNYGDKGPQGLIPEGKQVLAIVSRGGSYGEGTAAVAADFQVPYLRHMLGFVGLKNVTVVDADKQAFGPGAAQQSVDSAVEKLTAMAEHCTDHLAAIA
ncbi:MAG: FMN-dependent NADH-azoreductase [Candidatus Korobacteraceae bacterium]